MSAPAALALPARRRRAWLGVVLIFVLGFGVGAGTSLVVGTHLLRRALRTAPEDGRWAQRTAARLGAELRQELDLTDAQATIVQELLNVSASRLRDIRVDARARAATELRTSTEAIAATLPPEKRAEFYTLIAWRFERLGLDAVRPPAAEGARPD